MSNFTVNGVYSYTSANIYSYLGRIPSNERKLKEAFQEFNVTPHGGTDDLERLKSAMYKEYSEQVQQQIDNQNNPNEVPWAGLCAQIGVQATGDYEKDQESFNNALNLLSQSAYDGQAMAYFAGLRSEASKAFGLSNEPSKNNENLSFYAYQAQFLR